MCAEWLELRRTESRDQKMAASNRWHAICFIVTREESAIMLWTLAAIFAVLWVLGLVTSYTLGGFIHILIVLAVVAVAIRLIQGRRLT